MPMTVTSAEELDLLKGLIARINRLPDGNYITDAMIQQMVHDSKTILSCAAHCGKLGSKFETIKMTQVLLESFKE